VGACYPAAKACFEPVAIFPRPAPRVALLDAMARTIRAATPAAALAKEMAASGAPPGCSCSILAPGACPRPAELSRVLRAHAHRCILCGEPPASDEVSEASSLCRQLSELARLDHSRLHRTQREQLILVAVAQLRTRHADVRRSIFDRYNSVSEARSGRGAHARLRRGEARGARDRDVPRGGPRGAQQRRTRTVGSP